MIWKFHLPREMGIVMKRWEGEVYLDDRLFILDLHQATKGKHDVWAVTTRRNIQPFPPWRVDDFATKAEAIRYLMGVEPSTPRISLEGRSPEPKLTYEDHLLWCKSEGMPSAMELYRLGRFRKLLGESRIHELSREDLKPDSELIIEKLSPEEFEPDPDGQESTSIASSSSTSETLYRQPIQNFAEGSKKWFTEGDETIHVKYVGETKDGVPDGTGTETVSFDPHKGQKYVGKWKDGKYHGQGTLASVNGKKYVGEFKDNQPWNATLYHWDGSVIRKISDGELTEK